MADAERLERVRGMRGANYLPTWARGPHEFWGSRFSVEAVRRELGFAADLGLNGVRIWNSAPAWEEEPELYVRNLRTTFDRCAELGLGVDLVLFDSCGIEPVGAAADRSLEQALDRLPEDDFGRTLHEHVWPDPRLDLYEATSMVRVPDRGASAIPVWETWTPNPGYHLLGEEHDTRWKAYLEHLLSAVGEHPALVLAEVMNEPFMTQLGEDVDLDPIRRFYGRMHDVVRSLAPGLPLSIGAESLSDFREHERDVDRPLDVVVIHTYSYEPDGFRQTIDEAVAFGEEGGRPVLLSEWGSFPGVHDGDQLDLYRAELRVVEEAEIGWVQFHLVSGYGPFALVALLYPNGTMRPAAKHLRETLRGEGVDT